MSAESPRRGVHKGVQVVSPQPIVDRSIIDSVAGIINDIVPQGYAGVSNSDNKETISWARFEYADINDPVLYPDYNEGSSTPPLLLVLGYATGVQVWLIAATGEATEVLSWRQGVVRTLRILPNPKTDDEHVDPFEAKRPMVAICDSAGPGPQFCHISFISLKTSEQVKSIKFKNPVCDVLANRRSVVVTFLEKIAVFDARTLEDVITITTCYASPGPNPNPVALGTRWLAYSERKLLPARRSSGGCEGEGVQSYTATVLYAAKSLGKGLRGLGETVASSLTGNSVSPMAVNSTGNDVTQPGVVTILDLQAAKEEKELDDANIETVIAHFTAHSDAIVAMTFDLTGALLMTADRRGHDFHVFRIQPHPGGPTLAAVHHLYILHRGDTTAKVQDMVFSSDTRWAAISTVRGTTHVFPVAPYGGLVGVRTHSTPHVVNRLSRFHKSAGLTDDGTRSHSPVSHAELPLSVYPYSNPRLPPYPLPTILHPLSQIRQPSSLNHVNSSSQPSRPQQRQRLHSDDSGTLPLKICVCFAPPRAWIYAQRESSSKAVKRAVDSLFIMACHGNLIQYDLEPKPAAGVPKEKVCDDTMIELEVEAKGQWPLLRIPTSSEIAPPLPLSNPLLSVTFAPKNSQELDTAEDRWLSQVEIVTHAGPHRRLWMGPQFVFKTYNAPSGVSVNLVEAEAVEIGVTSGGSRPARSKPVNMPHASSRPLMPVVIDGSGSSYEQSPRFMEAYGDPLDSENVAVGSCESQLREDLAEAMLEISIASHRAPGRRSVFERVGQPVTKVVNPLGTVITVSADEEDNVSNSGQELFDSAEEILAPPEVPRSVCAEEGPASLGDLEPPECGQTLRDLTEICAEMRSASEPAIDSVPDENIRELSERRALCAEMRTAATGSGSDVSSIDFEREEAFRDVPTSLSLCAEQGEIPNSPMTRAKETVWYCKKSSSGKRDDHEEARERNFAKAKYVVNYDDDSVTLMENRTATTAAITMMREKNTTDEARVFADEEQHAVGRGALKKSARRTGVVDPERSSSKKSGSAGTSSNSSDSTRKRPVEQLSRVEKYLVKEDEDSVIIEDVRRGESMNVCARRQNRFDERANDDCVDETEVLYVGETSKKGPDLSRRRMTATFSWHKNKTKTGIVSQDSCSGKDGGVSCEVKKSERTKEESSTSDGVREKAKATEARARVRMLSDDDDDDDDELPPLDPPPLDDFSSIEYHMVAEAGGCPAGKDAAASSTQSDDDIEHIHMDSEMMQLRERAETSDRVCADPTSGSSRGQELSPVAHQRKSSKSTISDDDLEYIHSSELGDAPERTDAKSSRKVDGVGNDGGSRMAGRRHSKHALSSDDDLEHVQHSEIRELERASQKSLTMIAAVEKSLTRQQELPSMAEQQAAAPKPSKSSKRRKDIMVIDSEAAEAAAQITVIYNPLEEVCDAKCGTEHKQEATYPVSPTRKAKSRGASRTSSSFSASSSLSSSLPGKRAPQSTAGAVEIIDIDAIEKAEKMCAVTAAAAAAAAADTPKCKILPLLPKAIVAGARTKKSRKSKKWHADSQSSQDSAADSSFHSSKVKMVELQEAVEEEVLVADSKWREPRAQEISWSSIVKKNVSSLSDAKELDLEPLMEVEERSSDNCGLDLSSESAVRTTSRGRQNSRRASAPKEEEEEEEDEEGEEEEEELGVEENNVDPTTTTAAAAATVVTLTLNDSILIDLLGPAMFEDNDDAARTNPPRRIKYHDAVAATATKTMEDGGPPVSAEVVAERRRRQRFVDDDDDDYSGGGDGDDDDDAETRRGNAAVRGGESQESCLQLAAARRRRRQAEKSRASAERDAPPDAARNAARAELESTTDKRSDSEERGERLSSGRYSIWSDELIDDTTHVVPDTDGDHDAGNRGIVWSDEHDDNNACCTQQDAARRNGNGTFWTRTYIHSMNIHRKAYNSRSKKKKRR